MNTQNNAEERRSFFKRAFGIAAGLSIFGGIAKVFGAANSTKSENQPESTEPVMFSGADPYLGEIALFAFNFAPNGWYQCNGQLIAIQANPALFSLLGTTYGGNGTTNFALPNLQGRVALHMGQGPGLSNRDLGEISGEESHTLISSEIPSHNHNLAAYSGVGNSDSPGNNVAAVNNEGIQEYSNQNPDTTMAAGTVGSYGGGQAHNNMQPYLVLNYCIAYQGIFPSRP